MRSTGRRRSQGVGLLGRVAVTAAPLLGALGLGALGLGVTAAPAGATTTSQRAGTLSATAYPNVNGDSQPMVLSHSLGSPGYDLVGADGGVFTLPESSAAFYGSLPGLGITPVAPVEAMAMTVSDKGYLLVAADGGVFAFGNAPFLGSLPEIGVRPTAPITGIVAADTDKGYFMVGRDGGVFAFGTVPFLGSLPSKGISVDDVVGFTSTASGSGYWLVTATGTVYAFGAAQKLGTPSQVMRKASGWPTYSPATFAVAIVSTVTAGGYWVVTDHGSVYPYGDAQSFGTLPPPPASIRGHVVDIVPSADTGGYWLVGDDGGIFAFGDAVFEGSLPSLGITSVFDIAGAVQT